MNDDAPVIRASSPVPVPTPPADDVREVTVRAFCDATYGDPSDLSRATRAADQFLATFEVRPRGPVTDAEVEAARDELLARINNVIQPTRGTVRAALEAAREARP